MGGHFPDALKDIAKCSWDDSAIGVFLSTACNCKSFTGTSLAISKNSSIVTIKAAIDCVFSNLLEDGLLLRHHVENPIEFELIVIVFDFLVTKTIALEVELHLPVIWRQCQTRIGLLRRSNPQEHLDALLFSHCFLLKLLII